MAHLSPVFRFVLVLALAVSTQGLLLAQASWLVNQEWIAETLCVNPGTDCDGTCQLSDRMEKMSHGEHSHEDPALLLELALSVRAQVADAIDVPAPGAADADGPHAQELANTGREASRGVFHPPRDEAYV